MQRIHRQRRPAPRVGGNRATAVSVRGSEPRRGGMRMPARCLVIGHYVCYTRAPAHDSDGRASGSDWILCDDQLVTRISRSQLQDMFSPASRSASTAYILFYNRKSSRN